LVLGKARLALFYKELAASEGIAGVTCLNRVLEVEPANARAHRLLAEVHYRIGALPTARKHVEALRADGVSDSEVDALWDEVKSSPATTEDVAMRFHLVQRTGSLAHGPITGQRRKPTRVVAVDEFDGARQALAQVSRLLGVQKCAYIRGSRALVKGEIKDGKDSLLRVVRVLAKAAHRTARRMDLGNFSKGVLEGDFGRICICSYGEVVAAALCGDDAPIPRVLAELQELVAGSLFVAGTSS